MCSSMGSTSRDLSPTPCGLSVFSDPYAIDATRVHRTMTWVVSFSILMLRAGDPRTSRPPAKNDLCVFIRGRDVGGRLKANEAEVFPETGGPPPPQFLAAGPQPIQPRMPMPPPPPPMPMPPTSTYVNPFLKKGQPPSTDTAPVTDLPPGVTRPPTPASATTPCRHPSTAGATSPSASGGTGPRASGF